MNWKNEKVVVGLTGGIACGKSVALGCFRDIGWSVLSSDLITAEILASDKTVRQEIEQRWGRNVLARGGSIDKTAIARIVFGKELERRWLESLLHPIIRSKWISFVQSCPSPKCMIELPLLFEKNLQTYFTSTIAIFSPKATMIKRLQIRGHTLGRSSVLKSTAVIDKMICGLWIMGRWDCQFCLIKSTYLIRNFVNSYLIIPMQLKKPQGPKCKSLRKIQMVKFRIRLICKMVPLPLMLKRVNKTARTDSSSLAPMGETDEERPRPEDDTLKYWHGRSQFLPGKRS